MYIVNNITVNSSGSTVVLAFSNPITSLNDKTRFCFKIPCGVVIPTGVDSYAVQITYGDGVIPLWDKYGDLATTSELKKNKVIKGYFGTGTSNHVITESLPVVYNCGCNNVL